MRILAAALLAVPLLAHAVGLGNLRVLSALGQPLNAEIQIVSEQPGEMASVTARLASQDAFQQAGIDFNPVLLGVQFTLEHVGGKPVLKLTTKQAVNDPFLDILVELQWASGRLVREYTFLLDPPEYKAPQAISATPLAAPAAERPAQAPAAPPAVEAKPLEATPATVPAAAPAPAPARTHEVKKGDTLGAIARQNMPGGVTFNQMLIALYRANHEAFIRDNINLVRAGRILEIPDGEAVAAIDPEDAKRLVQSQMADFAAYRRKIAAAAPAAGAASGGRAASGRIGAAAEQPAPAEQEDQLKLSKADAKNASGPLARAAQADDQAARERALQEAQSRVTELEKNVADLQKLVELKNKSLAELQQKAGGTPVPAVPPAPEKPAAPDAQKAAAEPAKVAEPPKPTEPAKPATAPTPAPEPAKAPTPAPKPKAKPLAPQPPPPSFLDELLDNPAALGGLGAVLVLLLGYGAWTWRRRKKATETGAQGGSFGAEVGAAGASSVFSAGAPSLGAGVGSQASISQASVGGMEADEVDPLAEADVYMAYGRDAQAEEILKEALQKDSKRPAIHAKLLEIYAGRRDAKSFEQAAHKLQALTGGAGPEWEKVAALGRTVDPQNALYGAAGAAAVELAAVAARAPSVDFDLDAASAPSAAPDIPLDVSTEEGKPGGLGAMDFDLGATTSSMQASDFARGGTLRMDKDTGGQSEPAGLDFDLGPGVGEAQKPAQGGVEFVLPTTQEPTTPSHTAGGMDFDLNLDMGEVPKAAPEPATTPVALDLSAISLDLGEPEKSGAPGTNADPKWQEVATKLDLAKAYEEMGDKDGARELLNEAVKEGDSAQQSQARQMLASLG